jgi:hypothetical protein
MKGVHIDVIAAKLGITRTTVYNALNRVSPIAASKKPRKIPEFLLKTPSIGNIQRLHFDYGVSVLDIASLFMESDISLQRIREILYPS